jgi:hypothetical protein
MPLISDTKIYDKEKLQISHWPLLKFIYMGEHELKIFIYKNIG